VLKSELQVGKTYTHRTGASYRPTELVTLESLEPQKGSWRSGERLNANLVLVSYKTRYYGEDTTVKKTVLLKNLYPEQEYHEERARELKMRELRKVWEQQHEEMRELIEKHGQEIANRLGVERIKLERDGSRIKITHIYTLDQIKDLLGERASQ
jgi:hypothetical protein